MKITPIFFALTAISAHGALVSWAENFESFDTSKDALELQNPDWWTGPIQTNAIAVISTAGQFTPTSFQTQSLAVGGVNPVFDPEDPNPNVAYLLAPLSASFSSPPAEPFAKFHFDLLFSSGATGNSMVDGFRINFADQANNAWGNLLFAPALEAGTVTVYRYNNVDAFATGAIIPVNTGVSLDVVMDLASNKWTAVLTQIDTNDATSLFANVDINADPGNLPTADLGSFSIDWMKTGETWDDNFMLVDNILLESMASVPEPGIFTLLSVFFTAMVCRRRDRQIG